MRHVWIAMVALALVGACGGSAQETATTPTLPPTDSEARAQDAKPEPAKPEPAKPEPASEEDVIDRAVAMFIAAAGVINGATGDCTKMAADLNAWLDTNDAERNAVMDELAKIPEEERVAGFNDKMMAHRDVLQAMQGSVGGCVDDPAFVKAWERLEP